jgi:hypothetical protein
VLAVALLALLVITVQSGAAAQAAPSSAAFLARSVDEPVGTELRRDLLARSAATSWRGGPIVASTGETVTVYVSDTYPVDQVTPESWAEFLVHLTHGPEISRVTLYIAPYDEVSSMCGPQALGCYGDDEIVSIGEPHVDGTAPEEVVRHEYGHHIAFNRSNPPWVAVDWGPKRWASAENVCSKVVQNQAYPGDESDHYALNPGEAWAETYRLMDERKAGITTGTWQIVASSFYPNDAEIQVAESDVLSPWTTGQTRVYRHVFGKKTKKVWLIPLSTPLDGSVGVSAMLPQASESQVALVSSNQRTVLKRAVSSSPRVKKLSSTVCGQRSLFVRVTEKGPLGRVSVAVSTP